MGFCLGWMHVALVWVGCVWCVWCVLVVGEFGFGVGFGLDLRSRELM